MRVARGARLGSAHTLSVSSPTHASSSCVPGTRCPPCPPPTGRPGVGVCMEGESVYGKPRASLSLSSHSGDAEGGGQAAALSRAHTLLSETLSYTHTYTGGTKQEGARAKAPPPPPPAAARCVAFARSSWPRPGRARSARRGGSSRRRRRAAAACRRRLPPPHPQPPPSPPASARGRAGSLTIRRVIFWARGAAEVGGCARRGHSAEEWEGDGARTGGGGAEEEGGGGGARSEGGGMRGRGGAAEEGEGAGRALRRGRGAPRGGEGEAAAGGREKRAGVVEGGW